jgi:uncharacterized LabA/DUF88 family protein
MSSQNLPKITERVTVYVDGFNLYYGMREGKLSHARWLDLTALSRNLLKPNQGLVRVKYFTARIRGTNSGSIQRQKNYLKALETRSDLEIIYGRFIKKEDGRCHKCGHTWPRWEEKMTDVNMAAHLAIDASTGSADKALLISGDSDLAHAVSMVRELSPLKVVAVFPPKRSSYDLKQVVDGWMELNRGLILKSLMENPVASASGDLHCPPGWN